MQNRNKFGAKSISHPCGKLSRPEGAQLLLNLTQNNGKLDGNLCKIILDVVQFQEKFSFLKKVLLPKILLRLPTVHYGCYLQVSLRCELYTVSTTWLFFAISHLAIIMKSDHDQKQPSSTATPYISTVHYGLQKNVG